MILRRKRVIRWLVVLAAVVFATGWLPPARVGAGVVAQHVCSAAFVSHVDEREVFREMVGLLLGPARLLSWYRVDRKAGAVDGWVLLAHARSVFTPGYGCRLALGKPEVPLPPIAQPEAARKDDWTPEPEVPEHLRAALDDEFRERPGGTARHVKAVAIVRNGKPLAERYAAGYGPDTPMLSFSVAKSITNALLGVLVRQGRLDLFAPAQVPEWQGRGDDRQGITPNLLLRMDSGLDAAESGSGLDPVSRMLYLQPDMAAYAASRPLKEHPGTVWEYTSANTLLLDRLIGAAVGGGPAGLRRFAEAELFGPLGMRNVTLEFDGAGTFAGSVCAFATARDFARFGELYLRDGVTGAGQRILPEGWVAYSRHSTLGSSYGAGFWTNDGPSAWAAARVRAGFPKDGFFASGNLGQRIYVVPSAGLVITRFGYSAPPDFGMDQDLRLIAAAIAVSQQKIEP